MTLQIQINVSLWTIIIFFYVNDCKEINYDVKYTPKADFPHIYAKNKTRANNMLHKSTRVSGQFYCVRQIGQLDDGCRHLRPAQYFDQGNKC